MKHLVTTEITLEHLDTFIKHLSQDDENLCYI